MAERLTILVEARDAASAVIRKVGSGMGRLLQPIRNVASAFTNLRNIIAAAFAVVAIRRFTSAIGGLLRTGAESERVWNRVEQQIRNAGAAFGEVEKNQLRAFTARLQDLTAISDEEVARVVGLLTTVTGDYQQALERTSLVLDVATGLQMDYGTAARLVANAIAGDIQMLGRYIPELKVANDATLKTMNASQRAEKALGLLQQRFGGLAEQEAKGLSGALRLIGELWGDLREELGLAIGQSDAAAGAFVRVQEALRGGIKWIQENRDLIGEWTRQTIDATAAALSFVGALGRIALGLKEIVLPTDFERLARIGMAQDFEAKAAEVGRGERDRAQLEQEGGRVLQRLGRAFQAALAELSEGRRAAVSRLAARGELTSEALRGLPGAGRPTRELAAILETSERITAAMDGLFDVIDKKLTPSADRAADALSGLTPRVRGDFDPRRGFFDEPVPSKPRLERPGPLIEAEFIEPSESMKEFAKRIERTTKATEELARAKEMEQLATAHMIQSLASAASALLGIIRGTQGGGFFGALGAGLSIAGGVAATLATGGAASPLLAAALTAGGGLLGALATPGRGPIPVRDDRVAQLLRDEQRRPVRQTIIILDQFGRSVDQLREEIDSREKHDAVSRFGRPR